MDIPISAMLRPANMGSPWAPGNPLILWFSPLIGVEWPVHTKLTDNTPLWTGRVGRFMSVVADNNSKWLIVSVALLERDLAFHNNLLTQDLSPTAQVEWLYTKQHKAHCFWRVLVKGNHSVCMTHTAIGRKTQNDILRITGISLRSIRLPAIARVLDPDTFQIWIKLS